MKYNDTPNYDKCRQMFESGLKKLGEKNSADLIFNVKPIASSSKKETVKESTVGEKSPRRRVAKPLIPVVNTQSDSESEVENKSPVKVERKRIMTEEVKTPSKEKRAKITTTNGENKPSSSKTGSTIVINELPTNGKSKSKTYNLNLELDVSIDANIVVSVKRKAKKPKKSESQSKSIKATPTEDDDEDVIPNSNENTPVAKSRVFKSKNATPKKTTTRKSPRSVL